MFYNARNFLLVMFIVVLAAVSGSVRAQGLVSLSEDAMFDDGLDTGDELPDPAARKTPQAEDDKAAPKDAEIPLIQPQPAAKAPAAAPKAPAKPAADTGAQPKISLPKIEEEESIDLFGDKDNAGAISQDLFSQMSELEKRTALLNLELRREKLQNEIEAVKNQRRQALQQEEDKKEQQRLKNLEFEKQQEQKVLVEQQKLRDLDIQFETLRQEKLLGSYKNYMLEENQKWIAHNANFYKQIADLRQSKKHLTEALKEKLLALKAEAQTVRQQYEEATREYEKTIANRDTQLNILRNRIAIMEREQEAMARNPFAGAASADTAASDEEKGEGDEKSPDEDTATEPVETKLSLLYAITEIRGQGGELVAKLLNKNGMSFYVKKGTKLQTGHTISNITSSYVSAEKDGAKEYLYFASGGITPVETAEFKLDISEEDGVTSAATRSSGGTRRRSGGPVATRL